MKEITIPCSKCGDTMRINPFSLELGKEIKCPRCEQFFTPSKTLIEMVEKMIQNHVENNR
jgi:DNA-directed RNA polymerase subunit RPC12/RpoP